MLALRRVVVVVAVAVAVGWHREIHFGVQFRILGLT